MTTILAGKGVWVFWGLPRIGMAVDLVGNMAIARALSAFNDEIAQNAAVIWILRRWRAELQK
jgi:hypothetical protein